MTNLAEQYKEICSKIERAKTNQAQTLLDEILYNLKEINKLGYNVTVETEEDIGEYGWHEWGLSFTKIELCTLGNSEEVT